MNSKLSDILDGLNKVSSAIKSLVSDGETLNVSGIESDVAEAGTGVSELVLSTGDSKLSTEIENVVSKVPTSDSPELQTLVSDGENLFLKSEAGTVSPIPLALSQIIAKVVGN